MASINGTIPRFLLPRLTWNGIIHKHQTAAARSLSTPHHCRLLTIRRKFHLGPFHAPSSVPSGPIISGPDSSRKSYWRTYSASSSSFLVMPLLPRSTLSSASSFNNKTQITRRPFSITPLLLRDHHFDTLKCVQRLKAEGFSEEQAKAMMLVLSDVIEESVQNLARTMVLREGYPPPFLIFFLPIQVSSLNKLLLPNQTPTEALIAPKWTSQNFVPSSSLSTPMNLRWPWHLMSGFPTTWPN